MNPDQLWETTLDPETRTLKQVTIEDLVELANLGVEGAISGMAIYSGALDLKRAIETIDAMTTANN